LRAFKPGREWRVRESDLEEFLQTREFHPKALAPSLFNGDERPEKPIDLALEAAEKQAVADQQAIARAASSEQPQGSTVHYENEAMRRLLEYPHGDVAEGLVDLARRCVWLGQENAQLREALREWETEKA
jgi:hypothetical protein